MTFIEQFRDYQKVVEVARQDGLSIDIGKDELNAGQISATTATSLLIDSKSLSGADILNENYCL